MRATKQKLLITGASGLVGGHAAVLARKRWRTVATRLSHAVSIPGVETVRLDLGNEKSIRSLIRTVRPGAVLHFAARSNLDSCESDRQHTFRINAEAVATIAEACAECQSRLVFTSSDMVFDGEKGNYSETDPVRPISVYGESKCRAEEEIRKVGRNYAIVRVALVYGKPALGGTSFSETLLHAWKDGKAVSLFTDQFRSPIAVWNLAQALLEMAESNFIGTIHIGGADRVDRYTFGLHLAKLNGAPANLIRPVQMSELSMPAKRPRDASLDISKAKSLLRTRLLNYREGLERS